MEHAEDVLNKHLQIKVHIELHQGVETLLDRAVVRKYRAIVME